MESNKVIIFGVLDLADLAHYYLENDSNYSVHGFTVTKEYQEENSFKGLPVYPFEEIEDICKPDTYKFFVPMTARRMNKTREDIYKKVKRKGYDIISYVSTKSIVLTNQIGENCFILEGNIIHPYVQIGNNVVFGSGNIIGHHSTIQDNVFISSHVVLGGHCKVGSYSFFGVNAAVKEYTNIAEGTLVAMGASIKNDTEPWGVYKGFPAVKSRILSTDMDV
jgi:sugar O-acyltransferase (sialic acid O-acetyltransferase NeuD family)